MFILKCFIYMFIPYTFHKITIQEANQESYILLKKLSQHNNNQQNLNIIKDISKLVIDTSDRLSINKYIDSENYISLQYQKKTISLISYIETPNKIMINNIVFQPNYYQNIQPLLLVIFQYLKQIDKKKEINIERLSSFMKLEYFFIIDKLSKN